MTGQNEMFGYYLETLSSLQTGLAVCEEKETSV